MSDTDRTVTPFPLAEDDRRHESLRPRTLDEYIGQPEIVESFRIALTAARNRGEPIDHILVHPVDRLTEYRCWIVDTPLAREASDHLPVVADVTIAS